MIDLKKAKLEDFEIIKARPRDPKKKKWFAPITG